MQGIYRITNSINNHSYVGKSINIEVRWKQHTAELHNNKHHSRYFQNAWNRYGPEKFIFSLLEEVEDRNNLHNREVYWCLVYAPKGTNKPEYNNMEPDEKSGVMSHSEKTRKFMSETWELRDTGKPRLGVRLSKEEICLREATRRTNGWYKDPVKYAQDCSERFKEILARPEVKEIKILQAKAQGFGTLIRPKTNVGRPHPHSEETKVLISSKLKGKKRTPEMIEAGRLRSIAQWAEKKSQGWEDTSTDLYKIKQDFLAHPSKQFKTTDFYSKGYSSSAVRSALSRLNQSGFVIKVSRGLYALKKEV